MKSDATAAVDRKRIADASKVIVSPEVVSNSRTNEKTPSTEGRGNHLVNYTDAKRPNKDVQSRQHLQPTMSKMLN
jgi:hypothetical protein